MCDSNFPESFYRGLSSKDPVRNDNKRELSINWNDDLNSINVLLNQHKPGKTEKQFSIGYAELSLKFVNMTLLNFIKNGDFSFERKPIQEDESNGIVANPYHGNLLINKDLPKTIVKQVQCNLATIATSKLMLRD
jgi:hypothetical protein